MNKLLAVLILVASLAGCEFPAVPGSTDGVVIRSGTSFGMCVGYCSTELSLSEREVRFIRSSRSAEYPPLTRHQAMSAERWNAIRAAIDWNALAGLEAVYGCPDCADGGAEWIEVTSAGTTKRVTFEYGAELPELASLQGQIRALREHLDSRE